MKPEHVFLWTALVTPFFSDGQIDYESLTELVRHQDAAGNGILLLGSTGEALALSNDERCDILQYVLSLNPSVPVMVGVGGYQLETQIEWLNYTDFMGIAAYLFLTPIYAKPGVQGQTAWFGRLLDQTDKPCMLYNIPSRSGVMLYPEVIEKLADRPNLWAIKDAGGDLDVAKRYQKAKPDLAVYSGDDAAMATYARLGAKGCVSVLSNLWPKETHEFVASCLNTKLSIQEKTLWKERAEASMKYGNPVTIKAALCARGLIHSGFVRAPLSSEDMLVLPDCLR